MFARWGSILLAASFAIGAVAGIDLDVKSPDSIKSAAKTLASGIMATYKANLKDSGIPGLFSDDYYFWEAGAIWETLLEYSYLTGDTQFNDVISNALQHQVGDSAAFMPTNQSTTLGNDDQSFWGLAAMTAAETGFKKPEGAFASWVDMAANVFDVQTARWDPDTCDGGLRWQIYSFNNGYDYKNTISQSNFFLLAARLARFTGNTTYSEWAEKAFDWTRDVGLMTEEYRIYDGANTVSNCSPVNHIQWSYNAGNFAEGSAILTNLTSGDGNWTSASSSNWTSALVGIVHQATDVFTKSATDILYETACETTGKCNTDQKAFKGITARSLARVAIAASISPDLKTLLSKSAKAASSGCDGEGKDLECALDWTDDEADKAKANGKGLGEAFSALSVVQGLLWTEAKGLATETTSGNATNSAAGSGGGSSGTGTSSGTPSNASGAAAPQNSDSAAGRTVASLGFGLGSVLVAMLYL